MAMGRFTAKLRVWNPASPSRVEELDVRVDTGTTEGHTIERDGASVRGLGVTVDPVGKKLVPRVGLALTAI
jgi:hypothetical protein